MPVKGREWAGAARGTAGTQGSRLRTRIARQGPDVRPWPPPKSNRTRVDRLEGELKPRNQLSANSGSRVHFDGVRHRYGTRRRDGRAMRAAAMRTARRQPTPRWSPSGDGVRTRHRIPHRPGVLDGMGPAHDAEGGGGSTPSWSRSANRSGTPQCSTMRPSSKRQTSNTVIVRASS